MTRKTPKYLTSPPEIKGVPKGIPYIIGNEFAERFSFYGMKGILVIFMTAHLADSAGSPAFMSEPEANKWFHLFSGMVYLTPFFGALLSDIFLGKYRTIILLSFVYCLGHLALALDETRLGLAIGLSLIAIGAGGIKPCVSAHVGDQFGKRNHELLSRIYGWFYLSINVGAMISIYLTPILLDEHGPGLAFGVPGILMFVATVVFWLGRHKFAHVPPSGSGFLKESFSREGFGAIAKLSVVYVFVAVFWAVFDQNGSSWVLQARDMDRVLFDPDNPLKPSQVATANPFFILILVPTFSYVVYPLINRIFPLTPLRKIGIGLFLAIIASSIPAFIEGWIQQGETPHIGWQILAHFVITCAEIMISITCLEFSYNQAPRKMKSLIMAVFFLSVTLGNFFTSAINKLIEDGTLQLEGPSYFWFFVAVMAGAALLFPIYAKFYREKTYIQE